MYERKNTNTRIVADELAARWRKPADGLETAASLTPVWVRLRGAPEPVLMQRRIAADEFDTLGIVEWAPWLVSDLMSKREFQIFLAYASGEACHEIAARLYLSQKTVSTYRARVIEKTGLRNVAEMAVYAFQNGLIKWQRVPTTVEATDQPAATPPAGVATSQAPAHGAPAFFGAP